MFIPLTINQRREGLPNVLIAGDTAGIFYLLSHLTALELNIFLADTGILRPLREFPCHKGDSKDQANVYYDFFDGHIGAGVVRRMDMVLTTSCDLKPWTRCFQVPAIHLWQDASGTWLEFEGSGTEVYSEKKALPELIRGFISGPSKSYACVASQALVDKEGVVHMFPSVDKWEGCKLTIEESTFSAWDRASDLLKNAEYIVMDDGMIDCYEERRLIELGVPELDVLALECFGETKYVELTGDLARVFDGLF